MKTTRVVTSTIQKLASVAAPAEFSFYKKFFSSVTFDKVAVVQAARSGCPQSQFDLSRWLMSKEANQPAEPADTAKKVLEEIQIIKTNNRKKKKASKMSIQEYSEIEGEATPRQNAIFWSRKSAEQGHSKAMCFLGNLLLESETKEDALEAVEWYKKAAVCIPPHVDAIFNLGTLYHDGNELADIVPDEAVSLVYFQRAADLGDVDSLYWMGHCYASGEGGVGQQNISPKLAVSYLEKAAEKGHSKANYYLATIYQQGLSSSSGSSSSATGTTSHHHSNNDPLNNHCGSNNCSTCDDVGTNSSTNNKSISSDEHNISNDEVEKSERLFLHYLTLSVEKDSDPEGLGLMAELTFHGGTPGVPQDKAKGLLLYEAASKAGSAVASLFMGVLAYKGDSSVGVGRDASKAFEWYNIAAEQGSLEAWRNLASMYYLGDGVPKSEDTAKEIMRVVFGKEKS